jgi:hypothetical protein
MVQGGLVLLFLPWAAFAAPSIQPERLRWIERHQPLVQVIGGLVRFSTGYPGMSQEALEQRGVTSILALLSAFLVAGVAVVGLLLDENRQPRPLWAAIRERPVLLCLWYLTAPIAMMLAISLFRRLLVPRYMLMTAPAFLLLVALGLCRLLPKRMIVAAALIVSLLVPGLLTRPSTPRARDYRGAAALIAAEVMPEDVLIVHGDQPRRVLKYYLRSRESQFRWCPQVLRDASFDMVWRCLADVRRVWVVTSSQSTQPKESAVVVLLEEQFERVRTSDLVGARLSLYQRR